MDNKSAPPGKVQYLLDQKLINNKQFVLCLKKTLNIK